MEDLYEIKKLDIGQGFPWQNEFCVPLFGIFKNGEFIQGTQSNKSGWLEKVKRKFEKQIKLSLLEKFRIWRLK